MIGERPTDAWARAPQHAEATAVERCHVEQEDAMSEELIEVTDSEIMRREEAASRLRALADQLSRHNQIEFIRAGVRHSVPVPGEVRLKVEIEIGDENEIEFELTW
jgi:amphi-Trp domain-containing protein